jgi:hypothetical protein
MDPSHVVRLAGDALDHTADGCSRTPADTAAAKTTPLYAARRILHTGAGLLTDGQRQLTDLFAADEHVQVEATWGVDP